MRVPECSCRFLKRPVIPLLLHHCLVWCQARGRLSQKASQWSILCSHSPGILHKATHAQLPKGPVKLASTTYPRAGGAWGVVTAQPHQPPTLTDDAASTQGLSQQPFLKSPARPPPFSGAASVCLRPHLSQHRTSIIHRGNWWRWCTQGL